MPTLSISFDVPLAAIPRLEELLAQMNADRVEAEEKIFTDINDMVEQILKNRLKLLIKEAEHVIENATKNMLKDATPEQLEQIKEILNP